MFRTPEDLRDFCQFTPSVPPLTQTTETTLLPFPGDQEHQKGKKTLNITHVDREQCFDLEDCTEGVSLIVWFQGKKRWA